ncbi:unnamed protein product [Cuscuta epithymum]|uniref:Uncharacterized protein n=1 Tax=Cuscuta epithymum TaxID=186058 RepID=A0AAV0FQ67_9ASTE|nr:unnamed protein product [Cuscuta epithymum]
MEDSHGLATKKETISGGLAMRARRGGMVGVRVFQILVINGESIGVVPILRPPPEPPPWFEQNARVRESFPFSYYFFAIWSRVYVKIVSFGFCFVWICKTLALGLGNERSTVIIIGCMLPNLGLASYIALPKVINSESRPRADGYMWFFCYHVPLLNAILLI